MSLSRTALGVREDWVAAPSQDDGDGAPRGLTEPFKTGVVAKQLASGPGSQLPYVQRVLRGLTHLSVTGNADAEQALAEALSAGVLRKDAM